MDNGKPLEYQPFEVAQNLTNSKYIKTAGARMAKYEVDRTSYMMVSCRAMTSFFSAMQTYC